MCSQGIGGNLSDKADVVFLVEVGIFLIIYALMGDVVTKFRQEHGVDVIKQ